MENSKQPKNKKFKFFALLIGFEVMSKGESIRDEVALLVDEGVHVKDAIARVAQQRSLTTHTIKYHYYNHGKSTTKSHGNNRLTVDQERQLLYTVIGFSMTNLAHDIPAVRSTVSELFEIDVTYWWTHSWLSKNSKHIRRGKSKHLSHGRNEFSRDSVEQFIAAVTLGMEEEVWNSDCVVNYDETGIGIGGDGHLVIESRHKQQNQAATVGYVSLGSLLTFVLANGTVVWIVRAVFK